MECEGRAFELGIEFVATRAGAVAWKVREALLDVVFCCLRKCFQGRVSHRCLSNRARHGEMSVQEDADHVNRANSAYRIALARFAIPRCSVMVLLAAPFVPELLSACGSASDSNAMQSAAGTSGSSAGIATAPFAGSSNGGTPTSGGVGGTSANGGSAPGGSPSATGGTAGLANSGGSAGNTTSDGGTSTAGTPSFGGNAGFSPWPGGNQVVTVDPVNTYASDLSGVHYDPAQGATPAVLWAVQNQPSKLYRLLWNGTTWSSDTSNGWSSGKALHFPA